VQTNSLGSTSEIERAVSRNNLFARERKRLKFWFIESERLIAIKNAINIPLNVRYVVLNSLIKLMPVFPSFRCCFGRHCAWDVRQALGAMDDGRTRRPPTSPIGVPPNSLAPWRL